MYLESRSSGTNLLALVGSLRPTPVSCFQLTVRRQHIRRDAQFGGRDLAEVAEDLATFISPSEGEIWQLFSLVWLSTRSQLQKWGWGLVLCQGSRSMPLVS